MKMAVRGASWIFVYLAVAVAPLIFAWSGPEPGRGLLINFSVALGFVGLAMMDAAENALAQLGAPAENVHSERFGMV